MLFCGNTTETLLFTLKRLKNAESENKLDWKKVLWYRIVALFPGWKSYTIE